MVQPAATTQPTETLNIVGLDLSLTATGICNQNGNPFVFKSKKRGIDRLCDIRTAVASAVCAPVATLVVLEGYSYASGHQAHQLGELGGVIRHYLYTEQFRYVDIAPATLKKFATGKGNANKSAMGLAAARNGYDGPGDDNAIDAWWLRQLGLYANNIDSVATTAYRDDAVASIEWNAA